jgi:hypothetical protein
VADASSPVATSGWTVLLRLAGLALALVLGGCAAVPSSQGDPEAPVLVSGRTVDGSGAPIGGARLELQVFDDADVDVGEVVPVVFHQSFTAGADGTFVLHLGPTPELRAFGAQNGGFVNFQLVALAPERGLTFPFAFPRELGPTGWADAPPTVTISPNGIDQPGVDPGVVAPLPAET